jgi:hypothetical protein
LHFITRLSEWLKGPKKLEVSQVRFLLGRHVLSMAHMIIQFSPHLRRGPCKKVIDLPPRKKYIMTMDLGNYCPTTSFLFIFPPSKPTRMQRTLEEKKKNTHFHCSPFLATPKVPTKYRHPLFLTMYEPQENTRCFRNVTDSVKLQENRMTRHYFPRVNVSRGPIYDSTFASLM